MGELLTTQHDTDGLWHARYRTARRTLCGLPARSNGPGRNWPPTCHRCITTGLAFHRIDGSAPDHWGWPSRQRAAA